MRLHERGFLVAAETQGSVWRDWLASLDRLTISPKPPSSGMATERHVARFARVHGRRDRRRATVSILKIVCFDEVDLDWAKDVAGEYPIPSALPLGRHAGPAPADLRDAVGDRYRWLCEARRRRSRPRRALACCRNFTSSHGRRRPAYEPVDHQRTRARDLVDRRSACTHADGDLQGVHVRGGAPAPVRAGGSQVLPPARPQLPRRGPRDGRCRADRRAGSWTSATSRTPSSRCTRNSTTTTSTRSRGSRTRRARTSPRWIWDRLRPQLPGLARIVVRETCTSGCVYEGEPEA